MRRMVPQPIRRPSWWGGRGHAVFTMVVFVVMASLDNTAAALLPSMSLRVVEELDTSEQAITALVGVVILVTAVTAVGWGYLGDRGKRKRLLLAGTAIWAAGAALSATATSFGWLAVWQILLGVGLGCVASVGFSVISDFVSPRRRGLAMSLWGLAQGVGTATGALLASQLGAGDFRVPLLVVAGLGAVFSLLYLLAFEPPRGYAEPELRRLHESGAVYDYRIEPGDVGMLLRRPTNKWLILQGLSAQIAFGSLMWIPLLYQHKVMAEGYGLATATRVGGLLASVFQVGALLSILGGHIGDRAQARTLSGRGIVSAVGVLASIPFLIGFFFMPLRDLTVTEGANTATLLPEVLGQIVTNPWVGGAFLLALAGLALNSANSPNWFALITDANLPEHRGTVFGMGNLANGVGRAVGSVLIGSVTSAIEKSLPPPLNWAVGLTAFQVFFLPTGYCYWRAAGTSPADITEVRHVMATRGAIPIPSPE